jgi:uncharacterized coiled-coil protein SlyX
LRVFIRRRFVLAPLRAHTILTSDHSAPLCSFHFCRNSEDTGQNKTLLVEAKAINVSLSFLGKVVQSLSERKDENEHVAFKHDTLTKVLETSLGGGTRTYCLVTCSSATEHTRPTTNTLRFASTATTVKVKETNTVQMSREQLIAELRKFEKRMARREAVISELNDKVAALQAARNVDDAATSELKALRARYDKLKKSGGDGGGSGGPLLPPLGGGGASGSGGGGGGGDSQEAAALATQISALVAQQAASRATIQRLEGERTVLMKESDGMAASLSQQHESEHDKLRARLGDMDEQLRARDAAAAADAAAMVEAHEAERARLIADAAKASAAAVQATADASAAAAAATAAVAASDANAAAAAAHAQAAASLIIKQKEEERESLLEEMASA